MTRITIKNPYDFSEYMVVDSFACVTQGIRDINFGNADFLTLHTENGSVLLITPKNCGSIEVENVG